MNEVIWIANDHGGYLLKKEIIRFLEEEGIAYVDCGSDS